MTDGKYLTYPGFDVSFLVPPRHDAGKLDSAITQIKRDVTESAARNLPEGCKLELQDTA
jgi:hypothetical protein